VLSHGGEVEIKYGGLVQGSGWKGLAVGLIVGMASDWL